MHAHIRWEEITIGNQKFMATIDQIYFCSSPHPRDFLKTFPIVGNHIAITKRSEIVKWIKRLSPRLGSRIYRPLVADTNSLFSGSLLNLTYWDFIWLYSTLTFKVNIAGLHFPLCRTPVIMAHGLFTALMHPACHQKKNDFWGSNKEYYSSLPGCPMLPLSENISFLQIDYKIWS